MADTFLDETALSASGILERLDRQHKAKKRPVYRTCVAVGVTLVHILVVYLLVRTTLIVIHPEKPPPETQLLWLLLPPAQHSAGTQSERQAEDMVRQAYKAVQLMPLVRETVERPNAITVDPGVALGMAMACGAGKFEYLTRDGRAHCISKPWNFKYDRYGYIILDADPRERKAKEDKPRPSDMMAHRRNTRPVCPSYIDPNAPCLDRALHGDDPP